MAKPQWCCGIGTLMRCRSELMVVAGSGRHPVHPGRPPERHPRPPARLTQREREVLGLICRGHTKRPDRRAALYLGQDRRSPRLGGPGQARRSTRSVAAAEAARRGLVSVTAAAAPES
jgi:hypothetical protein